MRLVSSAARSAELSGLSHCENGAAASSNGPRAEPMLKNRLEREVGTGPLKVEYARLFAHSFSLDSTTFYHSLMNLLNGLITLKNKYRYCNV